MNAGFNDGLSGDEPGLGGCMQKTDFLISGMKCQGCVAAVSKALEHAEGFESASVDLENGTATVTGNIDPQSVCLLLGDAGYPAVVKSG